MRKRYLFPFILVSASMVPGLPKLTGMLGVSTYAARKIIDAISTGASMWTVVALLVAGGGIAAVAWALAKKAIKRFTYAAAITW